MDYSRENPLPSHLPARPSGVSYASVPDRGAGVSRGDYNNREPRPYRPSVEPDNRPIGIFDRSDPHHSVDSLPFGDERSRRRRSASPGPGLGPSRDRYGRAGFDAGEGGGRGREDLERDTRGNINYSREQDYRIGDSTSYHHRLSAPPPPHDRYDEEPASYFRGVRGGRSEGGFGDDFARGNTGGGRTNAPLSYHNDGYDHTDPYTHPRPVPPPMHQGGHRNGERDFPSYDDPRIPPPRRYDQQNQYSRPGPPTTSDKQMQLPEARGRTGEGNDRWERGRNVDREAEDWLEHNLAGELDKQRGSEYHHFSNIHHQPSHHNQQGQRPSEPSKDIIFLGIDSSLSEEVLLRHLRDKVGVSADSANFVRDKQTGQPKGYGFVQFSSLSGAEEFIQNYYPNIMIPIVGWQGHPPSALTLKIDYASANSNANTSGTSVNDRDGIRDIGQPGGANRVLLLRGLDLHTEQEMIRDRLSAEIVRLASASPTPIKSGLSAIQRIILIRDRHTKSPVGLAFIELASSDMATALLSFLLSRESQPVGFVIDGRPVASSFAGVTSFKETANGSGGSWSIRGSSEGGIGGEKDKWYQYTDGNSGASELVINAGMSQPTEAFLKYLETSASDALAKTNDTITPSATSNMTQPMNPIHTGLLKGKTGPVKIGLGAGFKKKDQDVMVALPLGGDGEFGTGPVRSLSSTILGNKTGNKNRTLLGDDDDDDDDLMAVAPLPSKTYPGRSSQLLPSLGSGKKMMSNISKWTSRQGELKADLEATRNAPPGPRVPGGLSSVNAAAVALKPERAQTLNSKVKTPLAVSSPSREEVSTESGSVIPPFDYRDVDKKACLLCQRQFKTLEVLGRHIEESELHKKNMNDPEIRLAGQARKVSGAGAGGNNSTSGPTYRDRAAERRQVFHQPAIPVPESATSGSAVGSGATKRKFAEAPVPRPEPTRVEGVNPGEDSTNKGNQLLKKMGWSQGSGLGIGGEGRVAPIETMMFAQGVGLGAGKPKEAKEVVKYQGKEGGYSNMVKDGARQRYEGAGGS